MQSVILEINPTCTAV